MYQILSTSKQAVPFTVEVHVSVLGFVSPVAAEILSTVSQ